MPNDTPAQPPTPAARLASGTTRLFCERCQDAGVIRLSRYLTRRCPSCRRGHSERLAEARVEASMVNAARQEAANAR